MLPSQSELTLKVAEALQAAERELYRHSEESLKAYQLAIVVDQLKSLLNEVTE